MFVLGPALLTYPARARVVLIRDQVLGFQIFPDVLVGHHEMELFACGGKSD